MLNVVMLFLLSPRKRVLLSSAFYSQMTIVTCLFIVRIYRRSQTQKTSRIALVSVAWNVFTSYKNAMRRGQRSLKRVIRHGEDRRSIPIHQKPLSGSRHRRVGHVRVLRPVCGRMGTRNIIDLWRHM